MRISSPLQQSMMLSVFLLGGCTPMSSLPTRPAPEQGFATLTLRPFVDRLVGVDVEVAGETRRFLVDTGAGITVISPDVARAVGCTPFGQLTGFRSDGQRLDGPRCSAVPLALGTVEVRPEAGVLDLAAFGLQPFGGMLALQTLEGHAFTLDLTGRRLVLESHASLEARVRGMQQLSVRPGRAAGGVALEYFVEVETPTGNLWLLLDSGNTQPVLLSPHALQQLGIELADNEVRPVVLNIRGLGPLTVDVRRSERIYDGLLNATFFEGRIVTFDLPRGRIWVGGRDTEA